VKIDLENVRAVFGKGQDRFVCQLAAVVQFQL
jgi:hypothetical protein